MSAFKSCRIAHEFTQTNPAPPAKVFTLLCPVREADWLPGWRYRLIYSGSGVAELGCIFTTPNSGAREPLEGADRSVRATHEAPETTWIVTEHDPAAFHIAYVWVSPGRVAAELRIQLLPTDQGETQTRIRYRYTGLSPEGNREVESYDAEWFRKKMHAWESAINHYLRTGTKISAWSVE